MLFTRITCIQYIECVLNWLLQFERQSNQNKAQQIVEQIHVCGGRLNQMSINFKIAVIYFRCDIFSDLKP